MRAAKRGEAERILSLPANLLARFHGLFPGTTVEIMGLVNRLLPGAEGGTTATQRGREVEERLDSRLLGTLTALGRTAARRYQHASAPGATPGAGDGARAT